MLTLARLSSGATMTIAGVLRAFPSPEHLEARLAERRAARVEPSTRTIQTTTAADRLRDFVDALTIEYRLTAGELGTILAGEVMRAAGSQLSYERASGNTSPLCLRYLKPASDDARVAEAGAIIDGITDAALHG